MARKTPNTVLFVFLGLCALVAGGVGFWLLSDVSRAKQEAAEAAANPPTLPAGPLQFAMSNSTDVTYVALDTVKRSPEGLVTATVVKVGRTVSSIKDAGPLVSQVATVDCAANRIFDGQSGAFTLDGKLLSAAAGYSGKRGRVVEAGDYQVPALCHGQKGHVVEDIKAALRQSQALPVDIADRAEANPKDHHNWAWLCAAAARGTWRAQAPGDCDKAVALRPDDVDGRLDRAYLFLKNRPQRRGCGGLRQGAGRRSAERGGHLRAKPDDRDADRGQPCRRGGQQGRPLRGAGDRQGSRRLGRPHLPDPDEPGVPRLLRRGPD